MPASSNKGRSRRASRNRDAAISRPLDALLVLGADAEEEALLVLAERGPALAVDLFEDLVHARLLGRVLGLLAAAAVVGAAATPALQGPLARRPDGGRARFEASVALREVVAEDAVVEEPALVEGAGLHPDHPLD